MTDEQLKTLAELVLLNDARICNLQEYARGIHKLCLERFGEHDHLLKSLHGFDNLAALEELAVVERAKAREYFGLPPAPPEK